MKLRGITAADPQEDGGPFRRELYQCKSVKILFFFLYISLVFLQSKEIISQLQEDLMKLLNELYTVN